MNEVQEHVAHWIHKRKIIVVAVSGGVDSMVLLHSLSKVKEPSQQIIVAHFMHHLRPEGQQEKELVQQACTKYGFIFEEGHWQESPQTHIESRARKARYEFFQQIYDRYEGQALLTGHHLNDDVETFLMRLVRGSSLKGLQGIQRISYRRSMCIIRPLLTISKETLYRYAIKHAVPYLEDRSNKTRDYYRNRVRLDWLPLLMKENTKAIDHINQHQQMITRLYNVTMETFKKWAQSNVAYYNHHWQIDLASWPHWSIDQQVLYMELLFEEYLRPTVGAYHHRLLDQLIDNLRRGHSFQLTINKRWHLQYAYHQLVITQKTSNKKDEREYPLLLNEWTLLPTGDKIGFFELHQQNQLGEKSIQVPVKLPSDQLDLLKIRTRRPGDWIRLQIGTKKIRKKIARLQMDLKISPFEREDHWLVVFKGESEVIWYPPYQLAALCNLSKTDKMTHIFAYQKPTVENEREDYVRKRH